MTVLHLVYVGRVARSCFPTSLLFCRGMNEATAFGEHLCATRPGNLPAKGLLVCAQVVLDRAEALVAHHLP